MREPERCPGVVRDDLEVGQLVESVYEKYGFDFRHYARPSLTRRLHKQRREEGLNSLVALRQRVLEDELCLERLLLTMSISVTSMFRDPWFYTALRQEVLPLLRTYPSVRLWIAGCATGEEVYSVAILLEEEGLSERTRIYATDMNAAVLERARAGVYPLDRMRAYTENYQRTSPKAAFSDYYHTNAQYAVLHDKLRRHVVFAQHDLVTDGPFNEFQLILCRNVMIYFDQQLRQRVVALLMNSLSRFGVLGLGKQESLRFNPLGSSFEPLNGPSKLYRKVRHDLAGDAASLCPARSI